MASESVRAAAVLEPGGRRIPQRYLVWIGAVAAAAALAAAAPHFFTPANFLNLLRQVSLNGIVACGMTVVLVAGGFDLSVGATAALAGVLSVELAHTSLVLAIVVPVLAGAAGGLLNGVLTSVFGINPLIVTLGTRYFFYAAANLVTGGFIQISTSPALRSLGGTVAGFPVPSAIFLVLALLLHVVMRRSIWGARLYALGSNERAARFSGIRTLRVRMVAYTICGACAALAGVVLAARSGAAAPDAGAGYELEAIAAAVVGGVSIFGGAGTVGNTALGVLLLGLLGNILVLARQPYEMQRVATGSAIVIAVAIDRYRRNRS